jgi:predicted small lipoprotein YifL
LSAPRRPAFFPALAILLLAGLTSACGVKGDPEMPAATPAAPGVKAAAQGVPEPGEPARESVFVERSSVQSGPSPRDILPTMPPKEWTRKKDEEKKARALQPRKSTNPNDRPFILDGLL